jgi:hypothetical protein
MANTVSHTARPTRGSRIAAIGIRPSGTRHPLVAVAMVLPLAVLLVVAFGGWQAVVTQASSGAGLMGH